MPTVSVIIPAKDAAEALPRALESIAAQTYQNIIEIIVAVADTATSDAAIGSKVIENPSGSTPVGLNQAIKASSGDVIVRCDAHAVLPEAYVERAVETLLRTGADNVGGMQVPIGETFWERAIAAAMTSRLGAGDARYRLGGNEGPVETVYLGAFQHEALQRLGGFDESFVRTQDYELNHRITESGGVVWFDPQLTVEYRPRGSLPALAKQYYEYGRAKRSFSRRHPGELRWRQLLPPILVVGLGGFGLLAFWMPGALLVPVAYLGLIVAGAVARFPKVGWPAVGMPAALATMHVPWGLGFLRG